MKLNLGSGAKKLKGFINIDKEAVLEPDIVMDLEQTPWDLPDNGADEIIMNHVLEHLGRDTDTFLAIVKELYRVAKDQCLVQIAVPHPLHSHFRTDPSHVRSISVETMAMFSKEACDFWQTIGAANTPFAHICQVDFEITDVDYELDETTATKLIERGLLREDDNIADFGDIYNNLISEIRMKLVVHKLHAVAPYEPRP